jgi:hypothetical protein
MGSAAEHGAGGTDTRAVQRNETLGRILAEHSGPYTGISGRDVCASVGKLCLDYKRRILLKIRM